MNADVTVLSKAAKDVLAERTRQISHYGWTPAHDDEHVDGSLAVAAVAYATPGTYIDRGIYAWPFDDEWWKPGDVRRNLVKAGALIIAEIERLDRAEAKGGAA